MPNLQLLPLAAEEGAGIAPFLVGGGSSCCSSCLLGILAFGKGREHS